MAQSSSWYAWLVVSQEAKAEVCACFLLAYRLLPWLPAIMQQTDTFNKKIEPMKKVFQLMLLCAAMLTGFSSCEKEVMYTITNRDGDEEYFIYEYNDANESIDTKNVILMDGETRSFTAAENAVKLKIYFPNLHAWVQQVYYLEDGLSITISGNTIVGDFEP